jgi:hypothetical protein
MHNNNNTEHDARLARVRDYAEGVAADWELDGRGTEALVDLVTEAVEGWTVAECDEAGDRAHECADAAAPIWYTEQVALLSDPLSLGMVNRGLDSSGLPAFDTARDDFYQWVAATAVAGWAICLADALAAAVSGLVTVDGFRVLGLDDDAADMAALLVRRGEWDGNLAGLCLAASLLSGEAVTA